MKIRFYTLLCVPCGAIVKTKLGGLEGMITSQNIRFDKVEYEVTYFVDGEKKVIWMNENEFVTNVKRESIGFVKQ